MKYGRLAGALLAAAVLCGAANMAAADDAADESRMHYEKAAEHTQKGELRAAVIELKNALQRNPNNADARLLLGEIYLKLGDGASAEKELRAAERLGIDKSRMVVALGRATLQQGRFQAFLDEFPAGPYEPAVSFEMLLLRAEAHAGLRQWDEARKIYDSAEEREPNNVRIFLGRGRIGLATGNFDEAEAQATAALARQPGYAEALMLQAEARRLKGDPEGALAPFREVLADKNQPTATAVAARLGLAAALIALQRDGEAEPEIVAVEKVAPKMPLVVYLHALIKVRQQDFAAARALLAPAATTLDGFPPAQFLFGVVSYDAGELETARSWLSRHLGVFPQNLAARKLLAATLLRLNVPEEAVRVLEPAYAQAPDDPQVLLLMGNAYVRVGRAVEASALLQRAAELAPQDPRVLGQLAISHLATGQRDEALTALNATLDLGADASAIGYALAFAHLRAGAFQDALTVAQDLRKRFPQSAVAANLEGAAYAALGQLSDAKASFEAVLAIDPKFNEARANLAALKAQGGDFAGAEAEYNAVLAVDKNNSAALLGMAALASHKGDKAATETWLRKAVQADPDGLKPSLALAEHYAANGNMPAAVGAMEALAKRQPKNPQVLLALGRAQARAGDAAGAVRSYQRLVEATNRSTAARLLLAETQLATGDLEAARASYEDLKVDAADNAVVWNNLAWLYQQSGDARAAAHGERALELAPGQPAILDTLGWILLEDGKLARATELLKQAHEGAPAAGDITYHYAVALHRKGDNDAARDLLTSLLQSGQPFSAQTEAQALLKQLGS